MINEHDMTRKMLNLIREATNGLDPIENQVPVPQNSLTPSPEAEPNQEVPQQVSAEDKGGPVSNVTISGELPSGVEFTMNYRENVGVQIVIPEQMNECELTIELSPIVTSFCISTNGPILTLLPIVHPYKLAGSTIDTFSPNVIFLIPDIFLFYF